MPVAGQQDQVQKYARQLADGEGSWWHWVSSRRLRRKWKQSLETEVSA